MASLQHKTTAAAGWYSNRMKESHFLGGGTESETAALPLQRVSKGSKTCRKCEKRNSFLRRVENGENDGAGRQKREKHCVHHGQRAAKHRLAAMMSLCHCHSAGIVMATG